MKKKVLFIDRDGTLIKEPPVTFQVDTLEQLSFLPGVLHNLYSIYTELDYELVMVTNQDGLGTDSYPEANFNTVQDKMMEILEGEGIQFAAVHIDKSFPHENLPTRKPGTGLLTSYFSEEYDLDNSYVIGDRLTDVQLAVNLGAKSIFIKNYDNPELSNHNIDLVCEGWAEIYNYLRSQTRIATHDRNTNETKIRIELNPDGNGVYKIDTGLGFFDHMLEQLSRHSGMDLTIKVDGDLHIDEHHTIEDTGIALGEALLQALGDKKGMERYGFCLPMDDCLAQVAIDFGGRSWIIWDAEFKREKVGDMPTEMFYHFFKSFCDGSRSNMNIKAEGTNEHHKIEAIFKAFAKAVKMAVKVDKKDKRIPTTKGLL